MQQKVALLELGGAHTECLYSQLLFLKTGGYHVTLICNEKLRGQTAGLALADEQLYFPLPETNGSILWKQVFKIRRHLLRHGIRLIIFNTAQSNRVRNLLLLPFPKGTVFAGTVHQVEKLHSSSSQRSISRKVKKYLVLNDYLLPAAQQAIPTAKVASYYPVFFKPEQPTGISKPVNELWVCIPGHIEYKRRDYETLITAWTSISNKPAVKFILGNAATKDGGLLHSRLAELGIADDFVLFDGFVSDAVQHTYLQQCDAVMPLIHPDIAERSIYLTGQISGNFNLAFGHKKPLLMHEAFATFEDFKQTSLFYKRAGLTSLLQELPQKLSGLPIDLYTALKWTLEWQMRQYLNFIACG